MRCRSVSILTSCQLHTILHAMPRHERVEWTPAGDAFTELLLEVFRLNGALIAAGNELCADTGLTSSRWQILGAIAGAAGPVTASQIARRMGLTRQTVQRLVDELEAGGLVTRAADPEHGRARPVAFTAEGQKLYRTMQQRQAPWANGVAAGVPAKKLRETLGVLRELRGRIEPETRSHTEEA